jgi:trk system potassium uptake protein TrkA
LHSLRGQSYLNVLIYSDLTTGSPIDVVISPEMKWPKPLCSAFAAPAAFDNESFLEGQAQLLGSIQIVENDRPGDQHAAATTQRSVSTLKAVVAGSGAARTLFAPPGDQIFPAMNAT